MDVRVNQSGTVVFAKAVLGHPLLRAASVVAAREFKFEPAPHDELERNVILTFIFLLDETEKTGLKRFECPYRILVPRSSEPIDISEN